MKDGAAGEEKKRSEGRRETMGDAEGGEGEKEQECGKINARGREQVRSQGERIKTYQGSEWWSDVPDLTSSTVIDCFTAEQQCRFNRHKNRDDESPLLEMTYV